MLKRELVKESLPERILMPVMPWFVLGFVMAAILLAIVSIIEIILRQVYR